MMIHNPYEAVGEIHYDLDASISGSAVIAHKSQNHNHPRGDLDQPEDIIELYLGLGEDDSGNTLEDGEEYTVTAVAHKSDYDIIWPWTDYGIDPEDQGVVAYPASEWIDEEHVNSLFSTVVNDDMGGDGWPASRREQIEATLEQDDHHIPPENGGLSGLAHPSSYIDIPDVEDRRYDLEFSQWGLDDGLIGIEIFGRREGDIGDNAEIELWDALLERFAPDRMLWGYGVDDYGTANQSIGGDVDRRWVSVLMTDDEFDPSDQDESRVVAAQKYRDGTFFSHRIASWDPENEDRPTYPKIETIDVDNEDWSISIEWFDGDKIEMVSSGDVVETQTESPSTFEIEPDHYPYVRFRLGKNSEGETFTNPFGIGGVDEIRDAEINDAQF